MAYKQPSSGPFKMMGSSPAKQKPSGSGPHKSSASDKTLHNNLNKIADRYRTSSAKTNMNIDLDLESKKALNQKLAKVTKKPTSTLGRVTKALKNTPKQLAKGGKEILKTTNRNLISGGKQILKKGGKFLGGKTLGVLGMLSSTLSHADQPNLKKGDTHYRDPKKSIF